MSYEVPHSKQSLTLTVFSVVSSDAFFRQGYNRVLDTLRVFFIDKVSSVVMFVWRLAWQLVLSVYFLIGYLH